MNKKKILFISVALIILSSSFIIVKEKLLLKAFHPRLYKEYVDIYSKEFEVDENLVYSIIKVESKFNKKAISRKSAKGLMQISDITQKWAEEELELGKVDIFEPEVNIKIGCWYINKLFREFNNLDLVITAYNGGSGNVSKWLKNNEYSRDGNNLHNIPFKETKNYLNKVKDNYSVYKALYREEETDEEN